ncbi:hypothetical protein NW759_007241 [Fusarium solani]|nr:hypothetical protein NW759_007241 [Fusarium solani]
MPTPASARLFSRRFSVSRCNCVHKTFFALSSGCYYCKKLWQQASPLRISTSNLSLIYLPSSSTLGELGKTEGHQLGDSSQSSLISRSPSKNSLFPRDPVTF